MDMTDNELEDVLRSLHIYGDLAGSEILTRALVAERNGDRKKALMWTKVFLALDKQEAQLTTI